MVDDDFNGSSTAPGFPQAGEIFVSFNFNPDAVRKLLQADGTDIGNDRDGKTSS